jgi:ubiquinone/menaquinone biosynthesis C-methylase UbiE
MVVADVGAGSGYMVQVLATAVGRAGRVIAIDPSPAAREHLLERVAGGLYSHIEVRDGTAAHTGLPDAAVDRILWQAVFHELSDREAAMAEAYRILKPGGRLVIVDWDPATDHVGPPKAERLPRQEAERVALGAGFDVVGQAAPSPAVWALVLERP